MCHQLPAGLVDHHFEFFARLNGEHLHAYCINCGQVTHFDDFDEKLLRLIELQIYQYPEKIEAIHKMGITGRKDVISQYIICNYGGFDNAADMIDGKLQPTEYWPCPQRGSCDFEGIICDGLRTDTGDFLTPREIQVTRLIGFGHLNKHIALNLNISLSTVTTHTRNIRRKTGLFRKPDITRFAAKNNLLS